MINLEKFKEWFNHRDMFSVKSGIKLVELGEGYSKVEMELDETGKNYFGTMHGGLLFTLADTAAGTSTVYLGRQAVTLSGNAEYIKPALSGKVIAEARVISQGKTIVRCEVEVHSETGALYCKCHFTMFLTDKTVEVPPELNA
ncbi:MAG TPA: PaaI family thioesterase [Bacillota bacterium]|nr:PaaI family thioesterase [Bacillota bacterium]